MPLLTRRAHIGLAIETTPGDAETVSAPLVLAAYNPGFTAGVEIAERDAAHTQAGDLTPTRGVQGAEITATFDMAHVAALDTVLQSLGFLTTGSGPWVNTPEPAVGSQKTATVVLWQDGRKLQIRGAVGTGIIRPVATANRLQLECTWRGIMDAPVDQALPANPASFAPAAYMFRAATVTLASGAVQLVDTMTLDLGVDTQARHDATESSGLAPHYAAHFAPTLELPTEAAVVGTDDALGKLLADTPQALSIACEDPSGNTLTIASPAAQRRNVTQGDRNGLVLDTLDLGLYSSGSAACMTITREDAS